MRPVNNSTWSETSPWALPQVHQYLFRVKDQGHIVRVGYHDMRYFRAHQKVKFDVTCANLLSQRLRRLRDLP